MKKVSIFCALLLLLSFAVTAFAVPDMEIEQYSTAPSVNAQAAIVIDYATGDVLWGRDIDTRRDPASMTKNMTAFIVYEEIAAGRLSLDTLISVSANAERASRQWDWGGRYIRAGQQHTVETMLRLIMLPSHNGACVAMAEHISGSEAAFVVLMNQTAERLGVNAHFINSHGAAAGNRVSTRGMAILVREFIQTHPDILRITRMNSSPFMGGTMPNTNLLLPGGSFFTAGADGFKTGTTAAAGHCLSATATRDGRRVITVIMNAPHNNGRYHGTQNLFNFGFSQLQHRDNFFRNIRFSMSADVVEVRPNTSVTIQAQLNNVGADDFSALGARWIVNGQTVATIEGFSPQNQQTFSLDYFVPAENQGGHLDISFAVLVPGGGEIYGNFLLPVSAQAPALFYDIHGHWAESSIERAVTKGLFTGTGDNRFSPNEGMTRGMFVTVLGRMANEMGMDISNSGQTPFADVPGDTWFSTYIAWAYERGIVQGLGGDLFGVNQPVTRQEAVTLLVRFMEQYDIILPGEREMNFPDVNQVEDWAYNAVVEAVRTGLLLGTGEGYLAPAASILRGEAVVLFLRFMDATPA